MAKRELRLQCRESAFPLLEVFLRERRTAPVEQEARLQKHRGAPAELEVHLQEPCRHLARLETHLTPGNHKAVRSGDAHLAHLRADERERRD